MCVLESYFKSINIYINHHCSPNYHYFSSSLCKNENNFDPCQPTQQFQIRCPVPSLLLWYYVWSIIEIDNWLSHCWTIMYSCNPFILFIFHVSYIVNSVTVLEWIFINGQFLVYGGLFYMQFMNIYVIKHIDNINLSLAIHCLFSFKRKRCKATSDNFLWKPRCHNVNIKK